MIDPSSVVNPRSVSAPMPETVPATGPTVAACPLRLQRAAALSYGKVTCNREECCERTTIIQ